MDYQTEVKKRLLKYIEHWLNNYSIVEVKKLKENALGKYCPKARKIQIKKGLPNYEKKYTLVHELLHLIAFELFFAKPFIIDGTTYFYFNHDKFDKQVSRVLEQIGKEDVEKDKR